MGGYRFNLLAAPQTRVLQARLKGVFEVASLDRGFHAQQNQRDLAEIIARPCRRHVAFLQTLSRALHGADASILDLAALESAGA